jgi:hypothetical protein
MEEVLPAWRTSFPKPEVRIDGQKVSSWNEGVTTRWTSVLSADRMRPLRTSDLTMMFAGRRRVEFNSSIIRIRKLPAAPSGEVRPNNV